MLFDCLHVPKHVFFFSRIPQQCRGVIDSGNQKFAAIYKDAVFRGDFKVGFDDAHSRNASETYDDFWVDQAYLCTQKVDASVLFLRLRIAIFRWATL